jgi:hypothetical protein
MHTAGSFIFKVTFSKPIGTTVQLCIAGCSGSAVSAARSQHHHPGSSSAPPAGKHTKFRPLNIWNADARFNAFDRIHDLAVAEF